MKILTTAFIAIALSFNAYCADDLPADWIAFKSSKKDAAMVSAIEKSNFHDLCIEYGKSVRKKANSRRFNAVRDFLLFDNQLNVKDLGATKNKEIDIGMSWCGVLASIGMPNKINDSTTVRRKTSQWVYRKNNAYVYFELINNNMIVTGFQNL